MLAFFLFGNIPIGKELAGCKGLKEELGMKITFENAVQKSTDPITSYRTHTEHKDTVGQGKRDISDRIVNHAAYDFSKSQGIHGWNGEDLKNAAGADDVSQMHNFMAVMSNSLSDEDFAKLQKDGYDPSEMDAEDMVTILDTMKAELLKAGVHIAGYTDQIDKKTLSEITGSQGYAAQISEEQFAGIQDSFMEEDIPLTEQNLTDAAEALKRGMELTELSEGSMKFMITNELAPTIDNLYLAKHSGAVDGAGLTGGYFREDMPGYLGQKADTVDMDALKTQMEQIIEGAGYPVTEETLQNAGWLVEAGIPLNKETFSRLCSLQELQLPMEYERVLASLTAAVADGFPAGEADLTVTKSIYRRAVDTLTDYENRYEEACAITEQTPEQITARRQLEEVRLLMTVEANVKLLKSGFSIDTAPIEDTISALKAMEENQTGSVPALQAPVDLAKETLRKTAEIPYMPAATISRMLSLKEPLTVDGLYETGASLKAAYQTAGEAYETMFTVPRGDYGDSIRKAFRNVDALLTDMGMELTDENRKALRSLSYNHTDLTVENLQAVKGASGIVERVVEKMTPMSVLKMIRDGVNPLQTSMEELEEYFNSQDTFYEDSEKYSRFLYRLEQNQEITPEEKASFIGIYRLVRQIEKTDGAAIGKVVDMKAELTFQNLLSAVRTGRVKGINISVDETFGGLSEIADTENISIDAQIDSAYNRQMLNEIRKWDSEGKFYQDELRQLQEPVTINNIMALKAMDKDALAPFTRLKNLAGKYGRESHVEKNLGSFLTDEVFADRESLREAYGDMLSECEKEAKELTFSEKAESVDVKALQLSCKQLTIKKAYAEREEYDIPCLVEEELTTIHLKLVHDEADKGHIYVRTENKAGDVLTGDFTLSDDTVSGMFTCSKEEAAYALQKASHFLTEFLQQRGMSVGKIEIVTGVKEISRRTQQSGKEETVKLYRTAGAVVSALRRSIADTERT